MILFLQRIIQILLVIRACIQVHGQQVLRRHPSAGGVELQFANGDARTVCAQVTEPKNSAVVSECGRLVERGVLEQSDSTFVVASHIDYLLSFVSEQNWDRWFASTCRWPQPHTALPFFL